MKQTLHHFFERISDASVATLNWLRGMARRCRGLPLGRIAYYAALALLLVLLGSASYAYRNRAENRAASERKPVQMAAVALRTASATVAPTPEPTPEPLRFVWPVEGEIVGEFAPDSLVWSKTLSQWQTHAGIDIAAVPGETVAACADGVVEDAWQDALWGNVVTLRHAEGYTSTYANLSTLNMVEAGGSVRAGECVGGVGKSASCESEMGWHVHFALEKDGEPVDFEAMMAERATEKD